MLNVHGLTEEMLKSRRVALLVIIYPFRTKFVRVITALFEKRGRFCGIMWVSRRDFRYLHSFGIFVLLYKLWVIC